VILDSHSPLPTSPHAPCFDLTFDVVVARASGGRCALPEPSSPAPTRRRGGHRRWQPRAKIRVVCIPGGHRPLKGKTRFEFGWSHHRAKVTLERSGRWVGSYQDEGQAARRASAPVADDLRRVLHFVRSRAAGGGTPAGGLGSPRCIVPRHVNIPTATRCGYRARGDLGASYGTRRAEEPAEGRSDRSVDGSTGEGEGTVTLMAGSAGLSQSATSPAVLRCCRP
jgi:hypothetical protein